MYKKIGYLNERFKLFHLKDKSKTEYSFHYHDFYKLIIFIKGQVTYSIEGKDYELTPYDIVIVGKNDIHCPKISSDVEYERYVLYLSEKFLEEDDRLKCCFERSKHEHNYVTRLESSDFEYVLDLLKHAESDISSDKYAGDLYGRLKVYEAILKINESVYNNGLCFSGNVHYNQKIVDVCEYINNHLNEELSVEKLADQFFISKYYFMRLFKEHSGVSLHQYIIEKRVIYALSLQNAGYSIKESSELAGFNDYSTYLRASKKIKLKNSKV